VNEEKMKRIIYLYLSVFLFFPFLCGPVWAEETQLPMRLPTIVVRGEDRSYLEIIRTRRPARMAYRGEK